MARLPAPERWGPARLAPLVGVVAVHAVLGYALIAGLSVRVGETPADATPLTLLNLRPPAPPPRKPAPKPVNEPPKPRPRADPGSAAPSPPRARAPSAEPLPAPPTPLIIVPPLVVTTTGGSTGAGAGGGGAGGAGTGQGGVGEGSGQGAGSGDGRGFTSARQIRGRFRNSDFPSSAKGAGRLKIGVRYAVGPSGRIDQCEIIDPSGYPEVDAMTCRVIIDRYRFKPARDGQGIPVTEVLEEDYSWRLD